jgi:putative membrane protein insertion efficiency factor
METPDHGEQVSQRPKKARRCLRAIWRLPRRALIGLVVFYQQAISPYLGPGKCRFTPTCSNYAIQAFRDFGAVRGLILSVWRVLRCNPFGGHGYDPPRWFGTIIRESDETNESSSRAEEEPGESGDGHAHYDRKDKWE